MVLTNSDTKRQNISEGEAFLVDRISNLPDSVLSYILTFLPTKRVIATSILSKRWRYVWTSVDKLDLHDFYCCKRFDIKGYFAPFVYRVLKLHQGNIRDLSLSCSTRGCNEADVTNWINTAVARGVERLLVRTQFEYTWPLTIFTCKTLVDLQLNKLDTRNMDIPDASFLPCLKKLTVGYLKFDTESLKHFISRCPVLEHFVNKLHNQCINQVIQFDIVSSRLKQIELNASTYDFDKKVYLDLDIPTLEFFRFMSILPPEIAIQEQLTFLVEADISVLNFYSHDININQLRESFVRFIQPFTNVRVLRLRCHLSKFLTSVGHAQFDNLTTLEIVSTYFEWRLLVSLMENSINLEDITLKKTPKLKKHKLAWEEPKNVPTCLSTSLRKISLDGYSEDELPMVEYVLRTAKILEQMDIHSSTCYGDEAVMLQKIQKLHRVSENVKFH
ncbi:hypothetical protein Leryth_013811 [Lithospermum erythrorhizon]|nr:hypothetical protein Leryth_013811 [Lithospermum erythrorhizon]